MLFETHIKETTKKFYQCANLAIKAFDTTDLLINAVGHSPKSEYIFHHNGVYDHIKDKLLGSDDPSNIAIFTVAKELNFCGFNVCPKTYGKGIVIIGPYICGFSTGEEFPYRPACCITHIVQLYRNIGSNTRFMQNRRRVSQLPYSLHIKRALEYMYLNYSEPITLSVIADYLKINKSYLCTLFKNETNLTFSQNLNKIRIQMSKQLLVEENHSILDITLAVGFTNQNYFTQVFKKLVGVPPLEYKNQLPAPYHQAQSVSS